MHVLVVLSHPNSNSLSHATAQRFMEGVIEAGHTCELADLHLEKLDPTWSMADIAADEGQPAPDDILRE